MRPQGSHRSIDISLVLPCFNEAAIIEATIRKVSSFLATTGREFEILVGDDGSTDGTDRVALAEAARDPRVRLVRNDLHRGKGAILTQALLDGRGRILAFIDADLEIDATSLGPLLAAIDSGGDVAIGSKVLHPDWPHRAFRRRAATRLYNALVRFLFRSRLGDHQAGIKMFRADAIREILLSVDNPRWTWDTEVLLSAQARRLRIVEVPVTTTFQRPSKVSLLRQPLEMAGELLHLAIARGARGRPRRDGASSRTQAERADGR
jgi:glycosyltransferase involved in cell wall biosynthesis